MKLGVKIHPRKLFDKNCFAAFFFFFLFVFSDFVLCDLHPNVASSPSLFVPGTIPLGPKLSSRVLVSCVGFEEWKQQGVRKCDRNAGDVKTCR